MLQGVLPIKKKKNNDQSENMDGQVSDYEKMLDGFSGGDKGEGDDGIALSDLLGESDSLELGGEGEVSTESDELKELDLDAISDLEFDDITSEELDATGEAEDESVSKTVSDKFEIDLKEIEQESSGDYSSVLSEMEGDEISETETERNEVDTAEADTEEIPEDTSSEAITKEIPEFSEDTEVSYASLTEDESDESSSAEIAEEAEEVSSEEFAAEVEGGDKGSDKDVFEKLADTEYSIEDEEIVSDIDEEFSIPEEAESEEEAVASDFSSEEETFVISGVEKEETGELEEDFLKLDEEAPSDGGILAGIAGVKQVPAIEVLLEGIEMDAEEQISAVTHAELLLAQGKEKEATELFTQVLENKGVTPWVSKRLGPLNIQNSTASEGTTETETTIESESE